MAGTLEAPAFCYHEGSGTLTFCDGVYYAHVQWVALPFSSMRITSHHGAEVTVIDGGGSEGLEDPVVLLGSGQSVMEVVGLTTRNGLGTAFPVPRSRCTPRVSS